MPLPEYRARELIQSVGIVKAGTSGEGLQKFGLGLGSLGAYLSTEEEKDAVQRAAFEGSNAVTRDEFGNLSLSPIDTSGAAGRARVAAQFERYKNELEIDVNRHTSELQAGHRDDPEGFRNSFDGYKQGILQTVPEKFRGVANIMLGKSENQGYNHVLTQKITKDSALAAQAWDTTFKRKVDQLNGLAAGGHFGTDVYKGLAADIEGLLRKGVEDRQIDEATADTHRKFIADTSRAHAVSREALNAFSKAGGGFEGQKAADTALKKIFDDPSLGLSHEQKAHIESFARADIARAEGMRLKEIADIASAFSVHETRIRLGDPVDATAIIALQKRAATANDPDLTKKIGNMLAVSQEVQAFSRLPTDEQTTIRREAEKTAQDPASGEFGSIRKAALQKAQAEKMLDMSRDGFETGAKIHRDVIGPIGELDFSNRNALTATLGRRVQQANAIGEIEKTIVYPLTSLELGRLSGAISAGNASQNAELLSALSAGLGPNHLSNVTSAIMSKGEDQKFFAASARLSERDPQLGRDVLAGYDVWKNIKGSAPKLDQNLKSLTGDYFGSALFLNSQAQSAYEVAGIALYALNTMSPEGGKGKIGESADESRYRAVMDRVTGGIVKFNGLKIVAPRPADNGSAMGQRDFSSLMANLTDDDLSTSGPGYVGDGKRITADAIRKNGTLFSVGPGEYIVRLNGYEVQDNPKGGREWRLKLGNIPTRTGPAPDMEPFMGNL